VDQTISCKLEEHQDLHNLFYNHQKDTVVLVVDKEDLASILIMICKVKVVHIS